MLFQTIDYDIIIQMCLNIYIFYIILIFTHHRGSLCKIGVKKGILFILTIEILFSLFSLCAACGVRRSTGAWLAVASKESEAE